MNISVHNPEVFPMLTPAAITWGPRAPKEQRKQVERWMNRDVSPFAIIGHPSGLVIQAEVPVFSLIHGRFDAFSGRLFSFPLCLCLIIATSCRLQERWVQNVSWSSYKRESILSCKDFWVIETLGKLFASVSYDDSLSMPRSGSINVCGYQILSV